MPLSVFIVCKNNAATIGAALDSVKGLATEIVAVDSGSTDNTLAILERHGAKVIKSPWLGYIGTKQMAMENCTGEWRLCLDSDEIVLPDLRASIEKALSDNDPNVHACAVNRKTWYRGSPLNFAWQPEWRVRLVRAGKAKWGGMDPHDSLSAIELGRTVNLVGTLRHDSFATFEEHLGRQLHYARLWATSMHAAGNKASAWRLITSPPAAFLKQMIIKQAWRDGYAGWLAAGSTAAGTLMKHMILLERGREGR